MNIAGVVLAGGRSLRMGGKQKALLPLHGQLMIEHVLARMAGQVRRMAISANNDLGAFTRFGLPVLLDPVPGYPGPLAGLLAALHWAAAEQRLVTHVVTVPADTPFVPLDLVNVLRENIGVADVAIAKSGGRLHHVVGLWPVSIAAALAARLELGFDRSVRGFLAGYRVAEVEFAADPQDPFTNINNWDDLARAEQRAAAA